MYLTLAEMQNELMAWIPGFNPNAVASAINRAYNDLGSMRHWSDLETEFNFVTKQSVSSGGANFTNGSTEITASTCAGWSAGESDGFAGMFIKKDEEASYYVITASTSVLITLTGNYLGKTTTAAATAGDGYVVFKHIYAIESGVESVVRLMHDSFLEEMDTMDFERRDPDLRSEGEPSKWRSAGMNSAHVTLIQLYPARIDDVYEIRGRGNKRTETLTADSYPLLDSTLIMGYAEAELMKRKHLLSPGVVSVDMLAASASTLGELLRIAIDQDDRKRNRSRYVTDNTSSSHHRGQKWMVSHDPADS